MPLFHLDIRTLLDVLAVGNLITLIVISAHREGMARPERSRIFLLGKVCQIAGWFLLSLRGCTPDLFSAYLGNVIIFQGFALECLALTLFVQRSGTWKRVYLGLSLAGAIVFCAFGHSPNARVVLASTTVAILFLAAAWALLSATRQSGFQKLMGVASALLGLILVCRAAVAAAATGEFSLLTPNIFQSATFLVCIVFLMMGGTGFLMLALEEKSRVLQVSQTKFSTVFRISPQAILLTTVEEGRILDVNESFTRMTGYPAHDAIGRTTSELRLFGEHGSRKSLLEALEAPGSVEGLELAFRQRNGETSTGLFWAQRITLDGVPIIVTCVTDISDRKQSELERERIIQELQQALSEVRTLSGLLPICASCKKIRDDQGYWNQLEGYLETHIGAEFTHGLCPDCMSKYFPDYGKKPPAQP